GDLYPVMDFAVEIECTSCHGTFDARTALKTARGNVLGKLAEENGSFFLTSRVTGKRHRVKQAKHVIDPLQRDFSDAARDAMTREHASLECYTRHAALT